MKYSRQAFSIVIPAFNEERFIAKTLERIESLVDIDLIEVIVVDNASTDQTGTIVSSFRWVKNHRLEQRVTISKARNIGWQKASHDIILFLDADVLLDKKWTDRAEASVRTIQQNPNTITGYAYYLSEEPHWIERHWFAFLKPSKLYINGGNILTSKTVLNEISGFNEELITAEDVDFCQRAVAHGAELIQDPLLVTHHEGNPKSLKHFFKREKWHGTGDCQSLKSYLSSKVAMVALLHAFLSVSLLLLVLSGQHTHALYALVLILALNLLIVLKKFGRIPARSFLPVMILNALYLSARFFALFNER